MESKEKPSIDPVEEPKSQKPQAEAKKAEPGKKAKKGKAQGGKVSEKKEKSPEKKPAKDTGELKKSSPKKEKEPKQAPAPVEFDLNQPQYYNNRELSWLAFNSRVLHEGEDARTPLIERVKFAAIFDGNLDEFFMKRIGGLKQQMGAGIVERTHDGRTPREQVDDCFAVIREVRPRHQKLVGELFGLLKKEGISVVGYGGLSASDQKTLNDFFAKNIYPLVTPQSIDPAHPFPFISNLSLNLLVTVCYPKKRKPLLARVKAPIGDGVPRFVRVGSKNIFVPIEEIIEANLDVLFPGMEILNCELFRVTRNANTEKTEENADDLMDLIESELLDRKFASIVRLEVAPKMIANHRGYLASELGLTEDTDVFESEVFMGARDLWELVGLDFPHLKDAPHHPIDNPKLVQGRSIFHVIRDAGSILLQHPYEAFGTSVDRFLREASQDPKVRAIKMTLYRTKMDGPLISHLVTAAANGKQVAVAVELKARFDEEANIRLANMMEEAGIHVTYGVVGLKTHAKLILVVRQDYDGIRRYLHLGTGNYHPGTSRIYSDVGLLTCDDKIGADATELFNFLTTGFTPNRPYEKLLVSPKLLKRSLLAKIDREIALCHKGQGGHIIMKMNALDDIDIARGLYRASIAGVKVDLIIRDSCKVKPGIPGLSENIKVVSIVGRFLEHARIYYFHNGGEDEYYIGSADAMKRNLEHRVESVAPVESKQLTATLREILDLQWNDKRSAWDLMPDGQYVQRVPENDEEAKSVHQKLIELADKRLRKELKSPKSKGPSGGKNKKKRNLL